MTSKITSEIIIKRFFSDDCSLGDKHFILEVLKGAVDELSNNPHKYPAEKYDKYESNETFFFKKVSTKFFKEATQKPKVTLHEDRTRRWGSTKPGRINKEDLLIHKPYENRFNQLLENLFFPLTILA